jgi:hypothetical protein
LSASERDSATATFQKIDSVFMTSRQNLPYLTWKTIVSSLKTLAPFPEEKEAKLLTTEQTEFIQRLE